MQPATKLGNLHIHNLPIKLEKLNYEYGFEKNNVFYGIRYYLVDDDIKQFILSKTIPPQYRQFFDVCLMVINYHDILPHIDSFVTTSINYYIKTSPNTITQFWNEQSNSKKYKLQNQTNGFVYDKNTLIPTFQFSANDNEIWILDVTKIHSVINSQNTRIAYCIQTPFLSYQNCLKIFKKI